MIITEVQTKKEFSLADVVSRIIKTVLFLLSRWKTILIVAFLFGLLGILKAWFEKPVYIAEMSFTTEADGGSKLNAYAGIAAQFGFDLGGSNNNLFEGDNLAELLKSRMLVEKTLLTPSGSGKKLMIDEYIIFQEMKFKNEKVEFTVDPSENSRLEDSVLTAISKSIIQTELEVFRKDKKLSMILLRMKSLNEEFSKKFVDLLASNAIRFYTDYKSRKARQNVEILQRQVDSVRGMLFGSISDVAAINDLNVNPMRQSMRTPAQRRQVDVQVNGTLYGELLKNLELAKLALRKDTPLIQVIDTPRYPLEKKKTGRLMGGIVYAFIGGILAVFMLLVIRYIRSIKPSLIV